ncbi:MAG: LiaF-related protein [Ignavibacteria bacterium]|nr:LiaF-related protein [Ignavibacteria bacterium]
MHNHGVDKRITFGIILIIIGGIFLLSTLNVIDFHASNIIFSFPFILFIVGILIMINSNKKALGGIFAGVGLVLLLPRIFPEINYGPGLIIPILLICLGIYMILRHSQKKNEDGVVISDEKIKKDVVDDVSIFGGGNKVVTSDNFKGGSITAIFGGSEIDLTNCKLAEGTNILDIVAIFGGTTIIVPKEWNVQLNVTPLFGGFSNKSSKMPNVEIDKSRTLVVKGIAIFGGGEVKTIYG